MNQTYLTKLSELKTREVNKDFLVGISFQEMINLCKAWINTKSYIRQEHFNGDNIWDCTCVDFNNFCMHINSFNMEHLFQMIKANLLYPDGTYNVFWLEQNYSKAMAVLALDKFTKEEKL